MLLRLLELRGSGGAARFQFRNALFVGVAALHCAFQLQRGLIRARGRFLGAGFEFVSAGGAGSLFHFERFYVLAMLIDLCAQRCDLCSQLGLFRIHLRNAAGEYDAQP